ncbi:MAG: alpha/beta hydrolase [Paracoccaceae bacterium]
MADIMRRDFMLETGDGVKVAIREVRNGNADVDNTRLPMILLHGTRIPGLSEYDLDVPGGSLAADFAAQGHVCYILDARGFGRSERPAAMSKAPDKSAPLIRSIEITRDIDAACDHLIGATGQNSVGIFGWGVGGTVALMSAARWPEKISQLVLYNMIYGGAGNHPKYKSGSKWEDPQRPGKFNQAAFGNYTFNAVGMLGKEWNKQIPIEDKDAWRDPAILQAFEQALIDGDPTANDRTPPTYRSPNGMLEDIFTMGMGQKVVHASQVYARVMIVNPEYDMLCQTDDMEILIADLIHAKEVRHWAPKNTTHYILFDRPERGRDALMAEMDDFLR